LYLGKKNTKYARENVRVMDRPAQTATDGGENVTKNCCGMQAELSTNKNKEESHKLNTNCGGATSDQRERKEGEWKIQIITKQRE
jgi:hypothetical protein